MTTFLQRYDVSTPSFADRRKSLSSPTSLAHRLLLFLAVMLMGVNCAWAEEVTLFTTDFSNAEWNGVTFSQGNTTTPDVINGITFYSKNSSASNFSISGGVLNLSNNVATNNYFMAIPISGVNGSVTISVANSSEQLRIKYQLKSGNTIEYSGLSFTEAPSSKAAPASVTINNLKGTDFVVYIGRQGSNYTKFTSITITTPSGSTPVPSATADFKYGLTSWTTPGANDMTITIPAHKAGQTFNVTLSNITDGASTACTSGGSLSGNTLSITAPAAGSNATTVVTVTKDDVTTTYNIKVSTETKTGTTFDENTRYSKLLIEARKDDFYSNTNTGGLGYGSNLDYVPGLVAKAMIDAVDYYKDHQNAVITNDLLASWYNSVKTYGSKPISANGTDGKSFDDLNATKIFFGLKSVAGSGKVTGIEAYNDANTKLASALSGIKNANTSYSISSSRTSYPISIADMQGGWWHKADYINQMWGDGQYMGTALLAQLINDADVYNESSRLTSNDWNVVANQIKIYHKYAWDNTANLPHHAIVADKGTNSTSHSDTWKMDGDTYHNEGIWGRAAGWYFMALVDVLEQMPTNHADYNTIKDYLSAVASGIKDRQDNATGCWYQLPLYDHTFSAAEYNNSAAQPGRVYNYLESSATALYTAAYLKAIRLGLLDKSTYEATAKKAYQGIIENFMSSDYNLYWCCRSAGLGGKGDAYKAGGAKFRDGSNAYYLKGNDVAPTKPADNITEGKVLGAFIMAATEYERAYLEEDVKVTSITLDKTKAYIEYNTTTQLTATVLPENAADKNVTWVSRTIANATVSGDGLVKGENNYGGTSTITVTANDGSGVSANCDVYVYRFSKTGTASQNYVVGDAGQPTSIYAVFPDEGGNVVLNISDFEVKSSDDDIVSSKISSIVDNKLNMPITIGSKEGDATITITYKGSNLNYYGKSYTLTYTVSRGKSSNTTPTPGTGSVNDETKNITAPVVNNQYETTHYTLGLPAGATASINNADGTDAKIEDGVLIYRSPAAGEKKHIAITITAEDGTTTQDYVVVVETAAAPVVDETIFSMTVTTTTKQYVAATTKSAAISNSLATINGGNVYYYNSNSKEYEYITAQSQIKIGHNASYVQIDLTKALANGDIINFTEGSNQICFTTTTPRNTSVTTTNNTYTVTDGDGLAGATTLYVWRVSSTPTIKTLTINRPAPKAHTVTFNVNGHTGNSFAAETESEIGAGVTLPKPTPFAGYTFLGWSTNQSATAADNDLWAYVDKYYPSQDVTLYAVYRQNPIGSQHTPFWKSFSDFVQLENGKAYTATFNNEGGDASYKNWVLIATSNDNGHNGDGVQNDGSNEIFCLRADGGYWSPTQAVTRAGKVYRYDSAATTCEEIDATTDADFVTDMSAGDANVRFSLSRVNDKLYLYAVTTCANEAQYVQTWESDVIEDDVYISFTTDFSKISSLNGNTNKAANLIVKETGGKTLNGTVDDIVSLEGVSLTGKGVAEGTEFKVKTTPDDGYELDAVYVNETGYWASSQFPMPGVEAVVGASFKTTQKETFTYTVNAVKADGTVLKSIATGTCTDGDAVTVAYPQYILDGTTLYGIRNNSTGDYYRTTFTPDQNDYVLNLTYNYNNKENVVYYTEAEDITGFTKADYTNRASNGQVAYSNSAVATDATLKAGTYQIFIRGLNGNSAARTATFTDGTNTLATLSVEKGTNILKNSAVFTLNSQKTIYVSCDGSSSSGLDWFYIQEVNALNVTQNEQKFGFTTTNVEANKYATADAADISDNKTYDGVTGKFYNIKTTSNYVEISEMNAIAFKVYAVHGNGKDTRTVNVYVDDTYVGSISVTPGSGVSSQVFTIPGTASDIHNIRLTGDKGNSGNIYAADIVFYNQKTAPTITPTNVSVSALQTKQFDVTAPNGCTITSMDAVSSEVAEVTYSEGKLTVQGKKAGQLTANFNIDASESSIFEGTTASVNITVTKADLVMKYNPDSYTVNADEETPELPAYELEYYVVEDDVERKLSPAPSVSVTYSTDDASVATVSNGQISLTPNASGSANITAASAANDVFNAAKAYFTINITKGIDYKVSSKPSVNEKFEVSKDGTTYVYGTYGGWKRNSHAYEYNDAETGAKKTRTDDWKAVETYNNAIDGFSKYSNGVNDAMNEDMVPNSEAYYGVKRNGWFESPLKLQSISNEGKKNYNVVGPTKPFSLPVRGTYMTFEPTVNGQLTIYILQNGAWNSAKDDVTDNDGYLVSVDGNGKKQKFPGMAPWQFRPHSFHVVDQNGMPIDLYTDFKINTKQPIQSGIITEEQLNSKKDGKAVYTDAQKEMVRKFCDTYSVKLGEKFKCISDPAADGYNDVTNICNWKEFKDYMSEGEKARVVAAWNTGVNGAQKVVEMDNGSFLAIDECIMKYSFYVAAGQTYYLFSNFSKMGFSGCNFVPDTDESAHPRATMTLSDVEEYTAPTLDATVGNGNNVKNISVPQYETITLNRSFTGGNWETICLPFTMTEKEVEDNFGEGTELIIMNGTSISGTALNVNFVYHEIQSILAGYPYLIKPTKTIDAITVKNKVIDPATSLTTFDGGDYTFTGISGYSTANVANSKGVIGYSVKTKEGDVFLSGNKLYISTGSSVIKGYRAYIKLKEGVTPQAKSVALSFGNIWDEGNDDNNVSTILHGVEADDIMDMTGLREAKGVYNLKGQKVGNTMNNLPAGIYVVNGKKTVIK